MRDKGGLFSFQGAFALIAMLFTGMVVVYSASSFAGKTLENEKNAEFERKTIFIADSMVKNHNVENPFLGAAVFDPSLGRVRPNAVSLEALRNAGREQAQIAGITVKKIQAMHENGEKETIFDYGGKNFSECLAAQRFIVDWGKNRKTLLEVTACE
ncbi:MAG: hypothetical protein Q7K34_03795 [archaeon]|nr:hypothetical protein [archaeon]